MGATNIPVIPPGIAFSSSRSSLDLDSNRPNSHPYGLPSTSIPGTATRSAGRLLPCSVPTLSTRSLWPAIPTMVGHLT